MSDLLPEFEAEYGDPRGDIMWRAAIARGNYICKTKLAKDRQVIQQLAEALRQCDEAMEYMSEYDIPIMLPDNVKQALAVAEPYLQKKGG